MFPSIDGWHDWFSVQDGQILLKLVPWLSKKMHMRVHHVYWNHETALRSYYLDVKWSFIVSAFEALTNTREDSVRMQFRERVGQLATHFSVKVTEDELNDAYTLRSEFGVRFRLLDTCKEMHRTPFGTVQRFFTVYAGSNELLTRTLRAVP